MYLFIRVGCGIKYHAYTYTHTLAATTVFCKFNANFAQLQSLKQSFRQQQQRSAWAPNATACILDIAMHRAITYLYVPIACMCVSCYSYDYLYPFL